MKSIITMSIVAFLAGSAHAADTATAKSGASTASTASAKATKVAKKKHKKKKSDAGAEKAAAASKAEDEALLGGSAAKAPAVQTTTYKAAATKPSSILKNFSGSLAAESYSDDGGMKGINHGTGDFETDYELKINYKLSDKRSISIYNEYDTMDGFNGHEYTADNASAYYWRGYQDPYIGFNMSDVLKNSSGVTVDTSIRYFAPLSHDSQLRDQMGQLRLYGTASKEVAKGLTASLLLSPRFYFQNNRTYQASDGKIHATDTFRWLTEAGLKYAINDKWALEQTLGVYDIWYGSAEARSYKQGRSDFLNASTSVYYTPAKWLEINAGIRQSQYTTDLNQSGSDHDNGLYAADQAEYFLITSLSL